jgi:hypothetical protein
MSTYNTTAKQFYEQTHTGNNLKEVIERAMHREIPYNRNIRGIDIGCGDAHILYGDVRFEGLEASAGMHQQMLRKECFWELDNRVHHADITKRAEIEHLASTYDVATANYVFIEMRETELREAFANVHHILKDRGGLHFSITHPETRDKTFPGYWSMFDEPWRAENRDQAFRVKFASERGWIDLGMTDYHNPTGVYIEALKDAGFGDITTTDVRDPSGLVARLNDWHDIPFGMIISARKKL